MDTIPPSFASAADASKQILTLSSAILALTVTFAKDTLLKESQRIPVSLGIAWILLLLSILGGVWTLHAITGELTNAAPDVYRANVRIPGLIASLSFVGGLAATVVAGWRAASTPARVPPGSKDSSDPRGTDGAY